MDGTAQQHGYDYDLLVIGSGPGGQKAAIAAAKLGRRAASSSAGDMVGGVCINTGTIPSKTLREAVLYLTGLNMRELYGQNYRVKDDITVQDLLARTQHVIGREIEVIRSQLSRNGVDLLHGTARFADPHTVVGAGASTATPARSPAEHVVIATGTRPARPAVVEFDERAGARLRRHPDPGRSMPALAGRGRRRGDRHRVRLDVRRPRREGDRGRAARPDARLLRLGGRRVAEVPPARPVGDLPVRREGGLGRDRATAAR